MKTDEMIDELEYAILGASALGSNAAFNRVRAAKDAIKAAIEELHRDAARYNWLKESDSLDNPSVELARCFHMYTGSPLDAAIDAAMEST